MESRHIGLARALGWERTAQGIEFACVTEGLAAAHELTRAGHDVTLADPDADVAEYRRMATVVRDASERANGLVDALLVLARSEAQPGWAVAVTGPLGAAAVALREQRALRLQPLLAEGRRLNQAGLCCGDISDGLVREMEKFAQFAGCEHEPSDYRGALATRSGGLAPPLPHRAVPQPAAAGGIRGVGTRRGGRWHRA